MAKGYRLPLQQKAGVSLDLTNDMGRCDSIFIQFSVHAHGATEAQASEFRSDQIQLFALQQSLSRLAGNSREHLDTITTINLAGASTRVTISAQPHKAVCIYAYAYIAVAYY